LCFESLVSLVLNIFKFQCLILINDVGKFYWAGRIEFDGNVHDAGSKNNAFCFNEFHECLGLVDHIPNSLSIHRALRLLKEDLTSRSCALIEVIQKWIDRPCFSNQGGGYQSSRCHCWIEYWIQVEFVECNGKITGAVEFEQRPGLVID